MLRYRLLQSIPLFFLGSLLWAGCSSPDDQAEAAPREQPAATRVAQADSLPAVTVYKNPNCGCCKKWVQHMQESGFTVKTMNMPDVQPMKNRLGVPQNLRSCHTAFVGGEVIEGHVPAELVKKYLRNDTARAQGLAVPGMPVGSPGMEVEGRPAEPYQVMAFTKDGRTGVYARR